MGRNPILIFGVDRSGTSAVASMVDRWGSYGGQTLETRGDSRNPKGYYENLLLQTVINEHLSDVFRVNYRDCLEEKIKSEGANRDFKKFIEEMEAPGKIWYAKEPFIGLMLPFFRHFFDDPVCIITVRNPYESALSWQKYTLPENSEFSMISSNLLRWQYILSETLINVQGLRKIFIPYEQLHAHPDVVASKLAGFLDRCYGTESKQETLNLMSSVIDNSLYRNKSEFCFEEFDGASKEQKELYRTLTALVENPERQVNLSYPMPLGWSEYISNANSLCELENYLNNRSFNPLKILMEIFHSAGYEMFAKSVLVRKIFGKLHTLNNRNANLYGHKYDFK